MTPKAITTRPSSILKGFLKMLLYYCLPMMNTHQMSKNKKPELTSNMCSNQFSCFIRAKNGILDSRSDGDGGRSDM